MTRGRMTWGVLALGLVACRGRPETRSEARDAVDASALMGSTRAGVHGMVVFGDEGQYLYHLPMWHGLHAWQLVIEARLDETGRRLHGAETRAGGGALVTFEPEPFALASLQPGFQMVGRLYHGHFEQGGTPLPTAAGPEKVTFTVQRLLMVQALSPTGPALPTAEYRLLGGEGAWFGVHVAHHAPDFDQILRLGARPSPGSESRTGGALVSTALPDSADGRPRVGTAWTGRLADGTEVPFTVEREEYFSTSDLGAVPEGQ